MTTITRGLSYAEQITVTTPVGAADDLTGATFFAEIRTRSGVAVADIAAAFTLRDGAVNIVDLSLSPDDTWALPAGDYVWDLLTEIDGVRSFLIPTEPVTITTPATRPEEV